MNLTHLRHLVALAEHQSFRKAADALFLTQPALSRSIQALENELGVRLLDRHGHKNTLTAYGQQVVGSARRVLFEATELKHGVALLKSGDIGSIRVGCGSGPAAILESAFLIHMATHYPRVQVKMARGSTDLLVQALRNERLDILAVDGRALSTSEGLDIHALPGLRGGFACREGHPLLSEPVVDLAMVRRYPVASTPLSNEIAQGLVTELGPDAHPDRLVTLNSEDVAGLLKVVAATDTIFFGIFSTARSALPPGTLRELRVQPHAEREGRFALVKLAGRSESPALTLFREFVRETFHD